MSPEVKIVAVGKK